ncbi:hypothetical protein N8I77_003159 [Diaporthe amygdali]|uniref:BTB domain-containing protein n=1 Tax=Phomopsis amygdali TaxID=1214568 RepID=A0AAD9W4M6_PHOAM|nr:hypothetical protein N8I77_003159 [Diaporthe amygdali]
MKMAGKKETRIWTLDTGSLRQKDLELFQTGMLADVEIRCDDHIWKLHGAILCARSKWFHSALTGSFKETKTRKVILEETEHDDLDCFLEFIYTGSIDPQKSYPGDDTFVALLRTWKTADFFCHDGLRSLAIRAANDYAKELAHVLCTAFPAADYRDKIECLVESSFIPAVSLLYCEAMECLKPIFSPILMALAVAGTHRLSQSHAFQSFLEDYPQFAADWVAPRMKLVGMWGPVSRKRAGGLCNQCGMRRGRTVDTFRWVRDMLLMVLCDRCYRLPALEEWEIKMKVGGAKKSKKRSFDMCA